MTFDLDAPLLAARDRARSAAQALAAAAREIDLSAAIPAEARAQAVAALAVPSDRLAWVLGLEEVAVVSGSLAVDAALGDGPGASRTAPGVWMGLRGVDIAAARAARQGVAGDLAVAAVLVGLARGAIETALAAIRAASPGESKPEQRHWPLADAATELEAARLLIWRAASAGSSSAAGVHVAMGRMQTRAAAEAAVAAARRVLGGDAGDLGLVLDRISRDVATTTLVFGGADAEEAAVAAAILP
jgi:hypothetical protein